MQIRHLVRYPVKGLGPDFVMAADVRAGGAMPFDREYAIAHASTDFDHARPRYLEKHHFLMLMRNPKLAALSTVFDEARRSVEVTFPNGRTVSCRLDNADDRRLLEDSVGAFVGKACRGGAPEIVSAKGHQFFDVPQNYLSLINLASVEDLGEAVQHELDPVRFRANLYVTGLPAWKETKLVGSDFVCGDVRLRAAKAIQRCAATSVDPRSGEVDVNVPYSLRENFQTLNMGLYLEVIHGGRIESGARISVEP